MKLIYDGTNSVRVSQLQYSSGLSITEEEIRYLNALYPDSSAKCPCGSNDWTDSGRQCLELECKCCGEFVTFIVESG